MKKILIYGLIAIILASCGSSKDSTVSKKNTTQMQDGTDEPIPFTEYYRNQLTDAELMDRKNATFYNESSLQLVGPTQNLKSIYFKTGPLVEGQGWQEITIPAMTAGKIVAVSENRFEVIFSLKDTIHIVFIKKDSEFVCGVKKDKDPNVPSGIRSKYEFTKDWNYTNYNGQKFYFVSGHSSSRLFVNRKLLELIKKELEGIK